ncbi:MAG: DUF5318 family protein [Ilumatobacteraceae bacterium]|jgi:hypothetical protein
MGVRRKQGWLSALSLTDDHGVALSGVIDHRLSRRALINEYRRGRLRRDQVCDAHPDLLRAARNFGDETEVRCPICVDDNVVLVSYVFGPRLPSHGRCITKPNELEDFRQLAARTRGGEYTAYVVEACRSCGWHHLLRSLPMASPQANTRRQAQ